MTPDFHNFFRETIFTNKIPQDQYEDFVKNAFKAFGYSVEFLHVLDSVYVTVRCKEQYIVFFNVYDNVSRETYFNKW